MPSGEEAQRIPLELRGLLLEFSLFGTLRSR